MPRVHKYFYFLLILSFFLSLSRANAVRPHIVLIMTDQQRADSIGCDKTSSTPRTQYLDELASEGVRFKRAYSSTPSCTPARSALLTGQSPWSHGLIGFQDIRPQFPFEFPRALTNGGYRTHGIGKMHFGINTSCNCLHTHGFQTLDLYEGLPELVDDYNVWLREVYPNITDELVTGLTWNDYRARDYVLAEHYHPTYYVGRRAAEFIDGYDSRRPFFLKVSFHRPHSPYDPPARFSGLFQEKDMPQPFVGEWAQGFNYTWQNEADIPVDIVTGNIGLPLTLRSRKYYAASVTFVDEMIGQVIEALKRRGFYENTLILFTSDHGDMLGDHHHWRKCVGYEGSARIPFLLRWPSTWSNISLPRGSVLSNLVELRDVLPTILEAARIPITEKAVIDGQSLLSLLRDPLNPWREWLDLEHDNCYGPENRWNAGTDGRWKYIFHAAKDKEMLFDLMNDPKEENNLAGSEEYLDIIEGWRTRLVDQFKKENRGYKYIMHGKLRSRDREESYSPHFGRPLRKNMYWRPSSSEEVMYGASLLNSDLTEDANVTNDGKEKNVHDIEKEVKEMQRNSFLGIRFHLVVMCILGWFGLIYVIKRKL